MQLDNIGIEDDKLSHEVAKQLRLLSSYFKDVDIGKTATSTIKSTTIVSTNSTTNTNGTHPEDDLPHAFDER